MTSRAGGAGRFALSAALSAALVAWLLRDVGVGPIAAAVRGAAPLGLAAGFAALLAMVGARVWRYRLLLHSRVGVAPLTLIVLVRGAFADLLPARAGSLAYVWLVTKRAGVPLDDALSSFLLAFLLDMVALAPLLLLALAVVAGWQAGAAGLAALAAVLLVAALAALWLAAPVLRRLGRALGRRAGGSAGWRQRLAKVCRDTADSLEQVIRGRRLLPAFGVSLLVRLSKFAAHWLLLQAVLVPLGVPWGGMPFFDAFLGIAGAELSSTLPVSGLAGVGTWEAAFTLGFTRLGLSGHQAVVSGFATHALTQAFDYGTGALALLALMWPRRGAR